MALWQLQMSNGVTHLTVNLCLGAAMSMAASSFVAQPEIVNGVIFGAFLGTVLTPDLDINANSMPKNILGVLKLRWLFVPYSKLFKHRSKWSHAPVLSTIVRWLYVLLLCSPFILYWGNNIEIYTQFWIACGLTWMFQDFSHQFLDGVLFKW